MQGSHLLFTILLSFFLSSCDSIKKTSALAVDCSTCSETQRNIVILDSDETLLHASRSILNDTDRMIDWASNTPVEFADSFDFLKRLVNRPNTDVYIVTAASPMFAYLKFRNFYQLAGIRSDRMFSIRNFRYESEQRFGFNPNEVLIRFDRGFEDQYIPGQSVDTFGSEITKSHMMDYILSQYPRQDIGKVTLIGNSVGDIAPGVNFSLTNDWNIRLERNRFSLILLDVRHDFKLSDTKKNARWLNQYFDFNSPAGKILYLKQTANWHEMKYVRIGWTCLSRLHE